MATVYLAEDLKHDRQVAVKVLRPELAAVLGAERFLQEIKTTANLHHPHILPLFDSGEADGFLYYVMPLLEGETLRVRLEREKLLPVNEAVRIVTEVANALDYAHRHGVVHRDIKPENILLQDGQALVADFGIALAVSSAGGARLTQTGLSPGTPSYMSPEQAAGERNVDARSDIYSVAVVLYEMLAGQPPHTGPSAQAIIARVALEEPRSLAELRRSVPQNVADAVEAALAKVPADRFTSASEFAAALGDSGYRTRKGSQRDDLPQASVTRSRALIFSGWTVAVALALWALLARDPAPPVSRVSLRLPAGQALAPGPSNRLALTPDGSSLLYLGESNSGYGIWQRRRDQLSATMVVEGPGRLFFSSPTGTSIAVRNGGRLDLIRLDGGPSVELYVTVGYDGGTWSEDGYLYLDGITGGLTSELASAGVVGLVRVPASGGELERVTVVDTAAGEIDHISPVALPGGKAVLFTVARGRNPAGYDLAVVEPEAGVGHRILTSGVTARYSPTGHLLIVLANGTVVAAPFDLRSSQLTGTPQAVFDGVAVRSLGAVDLALSDDGTLAYVAGTAALPREQLTWLNEAGETSPVDSSWQADFRMVALSPDGRRLAATVIDDNEEHIWIMDLPNGPRTRLTTEGTANRSPFWAADGRSLTFVSNRGGTMDLYQKRADGTAAAELLLDLERPITAGFWSPDGNWLVYLINNQGLVARSRQGDSVAVPQTSFLRFGPRLSHDGRYLAYGSNETGTINVFVQPFPELSAGRWIVPDVGARMPTWSADGSALSYWNGVGIRSVTVTETQDPASGRAAIAMTQDEDAPTWRVEGQSTGPYSMTRHPDGRLLVIQEQFPTGELIVVRNFFEELKAALD